MGVLFPSLTHPHHISLHSPWEKSSPFLSPTRRPSPSRQECVSEFISFVTSEASEKCQKEKRKTINGEDLLWAMSTLGFNKYVEPLKHYLTKYREANKESNKADAAAAKAATAAAKAAAAANAAAARAAAVAAAKE